MCSAASAAALSFFPPLAAFSASITAFDFFQALSWGGEVTTFGVFAFLESRVFSAGRLEALDFAV
jgi:hypothetical protein